MGLGRLEQTKYPALAWRHKAKGNDLRLLMRISYMVKGLLVGQNNPIKRGAYRCHPVRAGTGGAATLRRCIKEQDSQVKL